MFITKLDNKVHCTGKYEKYCTFLYVISVISLMTFQANPFTALLKKEMVIVPSSRCYKWKSSNKISCSFTKTQKECKIYHLL